MEQGITPYGVISRLSEQGNKNLLPLGSIYLMIFSTSKVKICVKCSW